MTGQREKARPVKPDKERKDVPELLVYENYAFQMGGKHMVKIEIIVFDN